MKKDIERGKLKDIALEYDQKSLQTREELKVVRQNYHNTPLEESSLRLCIKEEKALVQELHQTQVSVSKENIFLQTHFDLSAIINRDFEEEVTINAKFKEPNAYDFFKDIETTERDMHGLTEEEAVKQRQYDAAKETIMREAAAVKPR